MSGKHADPRTPRPSRKLLPIAATGVAAVALIGAAFFTLRPVGHETATPDPSVGPVPVSSGPLSASAPVPSSATPPSPSATRTPVVVPNSRGPEERAARGQQRTSPSPSATSRRANPPSGGGNVVSSGSCGVSYYDEPQPTASGEPFDPEAYTAAHKTLPFNTRVRVTNPANGKSVIVRINDRGPYIDGRCLDLARAPFRDIASLGSGVINAKYEVLG